MRALTIKQPWAWAIATAYKPVENRTWQTKYRGPVALHAAKTVGDLEDPRILDALADLATRERIDGAPQVRHCGYVLAVAELVGCHRASGNCCEPWGDPGVYHWELRGVRRLPDPVWATGRQGLWTLPDHVAGLVLGQTGVSR